MKRQIDSIIENFIDKKLSSDLILPAAQTNPELLHLMALKAMIGIRENGGNNSGKLVESIQRTIGRNSREAWCMSFQQCAIAYVEKKTGHRSKVPASEHCLTVIRDSRKHDIVITNPLVGDLIIYQYGDSERGHVACVIEDGDEFVRTVEGNTGPDKGVSRDGDGVYTKLRSLKGYGEAKIAGFVRVEFYLPD